MRALVTGGAGYVGSHMVRHLGENGVDVTTLDNLSSGRRDGMTHGRFVQGDVGNRALLDRLFDRTRFAGVMHFAAHIEVDESVTDPAKYYANNVTNSQVLLDAIVVHGVDNLVFSSSAAIFGKPRQRRIDEAHEKDPINPYGRTKLMVEQVLEDYGAAYGLKSVCLRYFSAAGADPGGTIGECHEPETHLISRVLRAASGRSGAVTVYGSDHDTPDGTCVRDYVHVNALCDAHLLAMRSLSLPAAIPNASIAASTWTLTTSWRGRCRSPGQQPCATGWWDECTDRGLLSDAPSSNVAASVTLEASDWCGSVSALFTGMLEFGAGDFICEQQPICLDHRRKEYWTCAAEHDAEGFCLQQMREERDRTAAD